MIVSTTLSGNSHAIIGDALRSVYPHVDLCLVIDTGITDSTLNEALAVVGTKLVIKRFQWINDFSAARNFALSAAWGMGAQWAMTLDTDERLEFTPGFVLRDYLATCTADVIHASNKRRTYKKERILRTGAGVQWVGPTHEAVNEQPAGKEAYLADLVFNELPKDEAALRRKFERDVPLLRKRIETHPSDARAYFYLGMTFYDRGLYAEAVEPLLQSAELYGWVGEGATGCMLAMKALGALGRWDRAIEACCRGLKARPDAGEFQFFLDVARSKAGKELAANSSPSV